MLPDDILQAVSFDLNDQEPGYEYQRWPVEQLRTYLQEALDYAALALRDLFVEKVVVQLEPGQVWQDACSCEEIFRVLGETTADGSRILRRLRRLDDLEENVWVGADRSSCSYGRPYVMEGYTINGTDGKSFMVHPPVPATEKKARYVLLECYIPPSASGSTDVPYDVTAAVKQWVLFRALMIDSENNQTIVTIATQHRDTFYKLINDIRTMKLMEVAANAGAGNGSVRPAQNSSSN